MSSTATTLQGETRIIDDMFLVIQKTGTIKAKILAREVCTETNVESIYLNCRIHDHNDDSVGEYAISGVISTILSRKLSLL